MNLTATFDTQNLNRAQSILLRHSRRSPARCINSTAYHVIKDVVEAGGGFPMVAQTTIDTELEVIVTPKIGSKGKPLKGKTDISVPDFSMAMMIVMARMNPNSKYSRSTGNRWPVVMPGGKNAREMIKGFGKAYGPENALRMFFDSIHDVAERMVRARHSSTGFLKKSWIDLKVSLLPFAMGRASATGAPVVTEYSETKPAKEGGSLAVCTVSNTLGVGYRTTKELSEKYNAANHRIAEPRLQASIDREFEKKMKIAAAAEWAKDEPELRALGMAVKP